jgi:hypothetical protein
MTHVNVRPAGALIIAASLLAGCAQLAPARGTAADVPTQMQGGMSMQMPPGMDAQMKRMQQMHERMAAARTPAERQALMAEQHKVMQDGMGMMSGMQRTQPAPGTPEAQRMTDIRMQMMESMMQMMMDRMDAMPPSR